MSARNSGASDNPPILVEIWIKILDLDNDNATPAMEISAAAAAAN